MPLPSPTRNLHAAVSLAVVYGTVIAVLGLAGCAWLAHSGHGHAATLVAEAMLLLTLAAVSVVVVATPPTRLRRARVPVSRAVPHQWWPPQTDPTPLIAACVGAPVAIGATAAVWLFH